MALGWHGTQTIGISASGHTALLLLLGSEAFVGPGEQRIQRSKGWAWRPGCPGLRSQKPGTSLQQPTQLHKRECHVSPARHEAYRLKGLRGSLAPLSKTAVLVKEALRLQSHLPSELRPAQLHTRQELRGGICTHLLGTICWGPRLPSFSLGHP